MISLINKIAPEKNYDLTKIGSVLSINEKYIAFVVDSVSIEILEYNRKDKKAIKLNGLHKEQLKCLKLSKISKTINQSEDLLCSCSSDLVIVWNLNKLNDVKFQNGKVIAKCLNYEPNQCSFNSTNQLIALCYGDNLAIIDINSSINLFEIKFKEYLNNVEFCLFKQDLVLLTNQTQSLMVYDLTKRELTQSIPNRSPNSFVNICCLEEQPIVLTSSSNGCIHVYEFTENVFTPIKIISLETLYSNYLKNNPKDEIDNEQNQESHASFLCIGLQLFSIGDNSRIEFDKTRKNSKLIIVCGTSACIFFIDFESGTLIYLIDFKSISFNFKSSANNGLLIPIVPQSIEFCLYENKQINAALLLLFQNEINIVKCADICQSNTPINLAIKDEEQSAKNNEETIYLTVFANSPLLKESPLNQEINDKEHMLKPALSMQEYLKHTSFLKSSLNSNVKDKPLTFNSRIKSSGYNNVPLKREKFMPIVNKTKKSNSLCNLQSFGIGSSNNSSSSNLTSGLSTKSKLNQKDLVKKLEFKFELPTKLDKKLNASDNSSPILLMKYSDDGNNLAIASNDNLVQVLSSSNLEKIVSVYNGHKDLIRSIDLSHDSKYLISSSDDKTCKLWSLKKPYDLLLDINSVKISESSNFNFKKEIVSGNFFYLDKFILIGTENKFLLCQYYLDSNKNDVQRYLNGSVCKLVKQMNLAFAQSITALSAINSFYSYVVIAGGSDKSIEVFDMNQAKSSLIIHEAHTRNFHQISQNGCEYNQMASYDLFLTCAIGDGIKLWDLRTAKCVNRFDHHINRCLAIKASFSPDSNYIVVGSEDRSALVYDLRMTGLTQKYGVFSDTVSNAQFNPKRNQLVCGTQDGKLYSYKTK